MWIRDGTDGLECVYAVCFNVCIAKRATLTSLNVFDTCDGSLVIVIKNLSVSRPGYNGQFWDSHELFEFKRIYNNFYIEDE